MRRLIGSGRLATGLLKRQHAAHDFAARVSWDARVDAATGDDLELDNEINIVVVGRMHQRDEREEPK